MSNASDQAALLARCEALEREQAELARFALIGQAFIGLAHELNNALNSMMLQTSVVQMRMDEQGRHELAAIRQHGAQAAGLVRTLQHAVQERREKSYPVDLNSVLTEIVQEEPELRRHLSPSLSPKAPHIHSTRSAVKQLVRLLLEGACAGKKITVKAATGEQEGSAVLSLSIAGADADASTVEALLWQNLDEVGRLAGQSLLRQLGGAMTAERTGDAHILRILWRQST
jgi:phosphoglycerate-specific signal transduction histidine kinase